jgi:hypothetical protein
VLAGRASEEVSRWCPAGRGGASYVEDARGPAPRRLGVALPQRDQLVGQPLGLFGFGPRRRDGLVLEQRRYEVAEQGLSVGRFPPQVAVFEVAACHLLPCLECCAEGVFLL